MASLRQSGASAPLHVVHVASGDVWAGAEVQMHTLLRELSGQPQIRLEALLLNDGELASRLQAIDVDTTIFDETKHSSAEIFLRLRKHLRSSAPDVIHTHRLKENVLSALADWTTIRVPVVRTQHGGAEHAPRLWQMRKRLARWMDAWTVTLQRTKIVAVSAPLAETLRAVFGPDRVVLIPNGIDADAIRSSQRRATFAEHHSDAFHVGFLGRLEPVKRVDLLIETAALLRSNARGRAWQFHVFGDGALRNSLESSVRRLGLSETVIFHGHRPDAARYIGSFGALLICSDHEGLPMTLLEAISAGTPVVAHAVGGIPSVMDGQCGGLLVDDHNAAAYAGALEKIASIDAEPLLAAGRNRIAQNFSARGNAESYLRLYRSLIE